MSTTSFASGPRARATDPSNGTRGKKRIDPMTRYTVAENGCWIWQGYVGQNGYGRCWTGPVHRHFYRRLVGPIPAGLHIDHTCHVPDECSVGSECMHRRCVNPDHLAAVTPRENVLRSNSIVAKNAQLTHCPHGHPYSGANLLHERGQRVCVACKTRMWGRQHEKERSRVADINQLRQSELAILEALTEPLTDAEIAQRLNRSRQVVCVARRALHRAGLIASFGTRPVAPGVRPAIVWKLA